MIKTILKYNYFILLVGLGVYFFSVLFSFEDIGSTSFSNRLADAFHFPLFFLLTLFLYGVSPKASFPSKVSASLAIGISLAAFTEYVQPYTGRSASWEDLANGVLGSCFSALGLILFKDGIKRKNVIFYGSIATLLLFLILIPAWHAWELLSWQKTRFPLFGDFEDNRELKNWGLYSIDAQQSSQARIVNDYASRGKRSLLLEINKAKWIGLEYNTESADWSQFSSLRFTIYNPGEPFSLHIRLDDRRAPRYEDRANLTRKVEKQFNDLIIPLEEIKNSPRSRELNLKRTKKLFLFVGEDALPCSFYLDNIRLE